MAIHPIEFRYGTPEMKRLGTGKQAAKNVRY